MRWSGRWDYVILYVAIIVLVVLLLPVLIYLDVENSPAWFQGIGTVLAMFGAIGTANVQRRHAEQESFKSERSRKDDCLNALLALIKYQLKTVREFSDGVTTGRTSTYLGHMNPVQVDNDSVVKLQHCADMFLHMPIDTLDYETISYVVGLRENAGAMMAWIQAVQHGNALEAQAEAKQCLTLLVRWQEEVEGLL